MEYVVVVVHAALKMVDSKVLICDREKSLRLIAVRRSSQECDDLLPCVVAMWRVCEVRFILYVLIYLYSEIS